MTDFVAVIRRAVDGLKDNNPEMRAKVYEKARAAVLKQLENMKPRPTDDVIARQMAKLDAAVLSVENEHADALPAENPVFESKPTPRAEPVAEPPRYTEPVTPNFDNYVKPPAAPAPLTAPAWASAPQAPAPTTAQAPVPQAPDMLWMPDEPEGLPAAPAINAPSTREPAKSSFQSAPAPAPVAMPEAIADIPWDVSPFDDEVPKPNPVKPGLKTSSASKMAPVPVQDDEWDELNNLADDEPALSAPTKISPASGKNRSSDVEKIVSKLEGKSFKAQAKTTKINHTGIAAGLAGLIIVGVGGYGVWHYRDTIMSLVNSTTPPATVQNASTKASTAPETTKPAPAEKPKQTQVALATSKDSAGTGKFTQRLLPDGSETSEALTNVPKPDGKEGKSVAEQTVKGKEVAAIAPDPNSGSSGTTGTPAATDTTTAQAPDASTAQTAEATPAPDPAASTEPAQKMFLYEERLGQASPTAINGAVTWSVANDTTATGNKPQSEIQAKITVPDRGMTALITFKRNTDKSLPASHVVELVFSLPKDFDGGAIESVQRIAMKQTEQDRGNSLIAVPAKITDDFHMIALNDDPAAVSSNTELLKNRSWIDIPITYRNGRRALITIEKGPDGNADFNKVMAEWAALSPA